MKVRKVKEVVITKHAQYRGEKRVNVRGNTFVNMVLKAYTFGLGFENARQDMLEFIKRKYQSEYKANNVKVWGRHVYIFKNNLLLSVIDLPKYLWSDWDSYSKYLKEKGMI